MVYYTFFTIFWSLIIFNVIVFIGNIIKYKRIRKQNNKREHLKNLYNALYFIFILDVTISLVLAFVLFGISFTGLIIGSSVLIFFDVVFILYRKKILIVRID